MKINELFVIDTNILIYNFDKDSKFFTFARDIIKNNMKNICLVHKSVSEFVSVLSKLNKYEIISNELPHIINTFHILYPASKSLNLYLDLIAKYKPRGNRAYDYEIISVMLANNIKKIVTVNVDDFKKIKEIEIISGIV